MSCKSNTKTKNEKKATASNGRNMLKGECAVCGTKKSKFIAGAVKGKKQKGSGAKMYNEKNKREFNDEIQFDFDVPKKMKIRSF